MLRHTSKLVQMFISDNLHKDVKLDSISLLFNILLSRLMTKSNSVHSLLIVIVDIAKYIVRFPFLKCRFHGLYSHIKYKLLLSIRMLIVIRLW